MRWRQWAWGELQMGGAVGVEDGGAVDVEAVDEEAEGCGGGAWWRGQRHLLAEYRPRPLHLQSLWQFTAQAGSAHVSLPAPARMILLQNLQLDRGRGTGRGGGAGDLVARCSGQSQVEAALVYRLTMLHLAPRWQWRGQAGALHTKWLAPALMDWTHALHFIAVAAGGAGEGVQPED